MKTSIVTRGFRASQNPFGFEKLLTSSHSFHYSLTHWAPSIENFDYSIASTVASSTLPSRWKWKNVDLTIAVEREKSTKMCAADSDLLQCAIGLCSRKWLLENHEERWMHYAILITHQSDITVCTTNFQTCLGSPSSAVETAIRIPIPCDMCLCNETLSDHISNAASRKKRSNENIKLPSDCPRPCRMLGSLTTMCRYMHI